MTSNLFLDFCTLLVTWLPCSLCWSLTECGDELPASLPLSQFKANSLPTRVRAHGVIALGKLCLQHEDLVQKYLPVFARELEVGTEVAVRNNVVVIMCDLCVRYTNIVDHYIPNISGCLRDNEAVIREQTLIMLTNLLQEEFVKWKGSLFFRFMVALSVIMDITDKKEGGCGEREV
ncbi:condensin-2 complex subunit D3-like [Etheostoma spectabile]|uniref:condensin-2 complex subunit D3-like n=1 Tax=Etheostoma spectabile TaxID=54343 RepID=UPI0013AF59F3|nr:condensin-2 complex subunit D3-like [Etheostoma spectabile]